MKKLIVIWFALQCISGISQENVTTVGLQIKPMLQTRFIDRGGGLVQNEWLDSEYKALGGYSMGMVIRRGFTETISLETGIGVVKRNYAVTLSDSETGITGTTNYSLINYQVPVQGLIYARLTDKLWMNASGGLGINFFPSNVQSSEFDSNQGFKYGQISYRTGFVQWLKVSILANYGFEYRTKKDGYYYLGLSFDRPFNNVIVSRAFLERPGDTAELTTEGFFTGAYLTIDLRYFFHEDPERKRRISRK